MLLEGRATIYSGTDIANNAKASGTRNQSSTSASNSRIGPRLAAMA